MSAAIKMMMVEIPKSLSIHNVEQMRKKIDEFSDSSLDIIRGSLGKEAFDASPNIDLSEHLKEEHLFSLDDESKDLLIMRLETKAFIEKAIDEIIIPYLTEEDTSVGARTVYKKIGTATYAISYREDYAYRSDVDCALIKALKVSSVLTGKL